MNCDSFLVVEIPRLQSPVGAFTQRHPDAVLDVVLETPASERPGGAMTAVARARGGPPRDLVSMLSVVEGTYPTRVLRTPGYDGTWEATYRMQKPMADPTARALQRFMDEFGLRIRWVRLQDGTCFVRALVPPPANAHDLADQCRAYLNAMGLDADIDVETVSQDRADMWVAQLKGILAAH